jgi:hypothetical protein
LGALTADLLMSSSSISDNHCACLEQKVVSEKNPVMFSYKQDLSLAFFYAIPA